jgi:hypothetical protein
MVDVLFIDPETGDTALFVDPGGGGAWDDIAAPMNRPAKNPLNWLSHIYFHSALDPMEVAIGPTNVSVSHGTIPAGTPSGGVVGLNNGRVYGGYTTSHVLLTHSLGYVPDFFILQGSNTLHPGYPIQFDSADGRSRNVTAYATTSQIILYEYGVQTSNALAGVSVTYTLLVLRRPPAPTGSAMMEFDPDTGVVKMGRDKFSSDRRYLQVVPGGSPYSLPLERTVDLANGAPRSVSPDGTIRDVVPPSFRIAYGFGGPSFGPDGNYNGSFTGAPAIQVKAP